MRSYSYSRRRLLPLIATLILSYTVCQAQKPLKVWLETPQTEYKFCADVFLYLFVVNEGVVAVRVPFVDESQKQAMKLEITRNNGTLLRYTGLTGATHEDSISLLPLDTVMFTISLIEGYGQGGFHTKYPSSIPIGEYSVAGEYFGDLRVSDLAFSVVPLNGREERVVEEFTSLWNAPSLTIAGLNQFGRLLERSLATPFCSRLGELVLTYTVPHSDSSQARELKAKYAERILKSCPCGAAELDAFAALLHARGVPSFRKTLLEHRGVFQSKYTRFQLREVLRRDQKSYLYDKVMKDVANNH